MAKRSQTPRFEVDFSSRLEQQKIAKAQHPLSKRKVVWTRREVETDGWPNVYQRLIFDSFGWKKQILTDSEITLLILQGYNIKDQDPVEEYKNLILRTRSYKVKVTNSSTQKLTCRYY